MRLSPRPIVTVLAIVFGTGTLSPLVGANWQEWAKATGHDQYFVKYAGPAIDGMLSLTHSPWFIFAAGFFVGGAVFLWVESRLSSPSTEKATLAANAVDIAHALHLTDQGVDVRIDAAKKVVQIGFNLQNSVAIPLRYEVQEMSVIIDGKTVMNPTFSNRGGVVPRNQRTQFHFAPIPAVIGKSGSVAQASIVYQYGPATADTPFLREATYRVEITIKKNGTPYVILEENDAEI